MDNTKKTEQTGIAGDTAREAKKAQRKEVKELLQGIDREYIEAASASIAERVIASKAFKDARTIFCYMNFGKEVITDRIIEAALDAGKRVCIPLCLDNHLMEAKLFTRDTVLVSGAYGIMEPAASEPCIEPCEIDLGIIPCVACDSGCRRLGHGAGYYDRYLSVSGMKRVALCLDRLMLDKVVTDRYDVLMDAVVTESSWYGVE